MPLAVMAHVYAPGIRVAWTHSTLKIVLADKREKPSWWEKIEKPC